MNAFHAYCQNALDDIRAQGRYRVFTPLQKRAADFPWYLRPDGSHVLVWSANDYLAMGGHPVLVEAACEAARAKGARVAAPRFPGAGPVSLGVSPDGHAWAVVAAEEAGRVGLLDSTTGAEAWSVPFPASFWAAPALSGDIVVAGGSGRDGVLLRGLDLATGSIRWEVRPGAVGSAPLVAGGRIYVAAGPTPSRARVRALDVTTGRRLWSTAVPGRYDGGIQPGVDGSRLLVLDSLGTLVALDTTTGRVDWVLPTHHDVVEGRVATGAGVAAFTTYLDEVAEVDTATGAVLDAWRPAGVPVDLVVGPGVLVEALRLADPARVAAVTLARRRP